jgi:adenosylmethionine-8-amino-7-oxononanoate aminotransferase
MACREAGILVRPLGKGVAVSPPLIAEQAEIDLIGSALAEGLQALEPVAAAS